jgi:hypothetical protein
MSQPARPSALSPPALTERKTSWTPPARNPVSLRLYKVLGTNFNDEATREALETLSLLYANQPSRKGKEPGREQDDDQVVEEQAVEAESVPGEIAARARKNLRRDMDRKLAEGSRQFLNALGEVDQVCVILSHYGYRATYAT